MEISQPLISQEDGQIVYRVRVQCDKEEHTLWYSLPESSGDLVSSSSDAALVALLIPAMAIGEDVTVDGVVSERLFHNLSGPLQVVLQHVIPSLHQVRIYANNVSSDQTRSATNDGVATGFSGGIDSYSVLADHHYSEISKGFRLTHLLFNNVGSHGPGSSGERVFHQRYERLLPATERIGLPFVKVNTNVDSMYGSGLSFQQTHTLRNASVALLLQKGIGRYLYASTYSYSDVFVGATYDSAYSDPITLPLLSSDALDACSVGGEYTRVQKTLRVSEIACSFGTLDVCTRPGASGYTNCSTCGKCLRTLATLEVAGYLERYSASFDLSAYRSCRGAYFAGMYKSHDPFLREIVLFAKERDYSFPLLSRFLHYSGIYPVKRLSRRMYRYLARNVVS